ncbi:uncharacterized protein LOC135369652 [Ornithodoros turicata]|uniref:uncharacterized protein LOC135369652 n=1 Tax=Ornithodoros turicata TaxID=34597 RepID=UPI003138998E
MPATKLRAATYLSPGIPAEYFEGILHYLERKLNVHSSLIYESRWYGPPADRGDPFSDGDIDMAFMTPIAFVHRLEAGNKAMELLPVSSVHQHRLGSDEPGHFADVVINASLQSSSIEKFDQLRGYKWAYTGPESFSGHQVTLQELKKRGETANFFGNKVPAHSHLDSLYMILDQQVDAAAVDANCLALFLDRNPAYKEKLVVIDSWGPLPPYPIVMKKELPEELKSSIASALLTMHEDEIGAKVLAKFHVHNFAPVSLDQFLEFRESLRNVSKLSFATVYY